MPGHERTAISMGQPKVKRTKMKSTYGNGLHLTLADLQACAVLFSLLTDMPSVTPRNHHLRELTKRPHLDTRLRCAATAGVCTLSLSNSA